MAQRRNDFTSSLLQRRDRFWSRLSAARRREEEQGQASKAAIQAGRDSVVNFFRRAERREDDQTRRNKNFISRIVNGKNFLSPRTLTWESSRLERQHQSQAGGGGRHH